MAELLAPRTIASNRRNPVVKLEEAQVEATELTYITAIVLPENLFFAQQCKYTNKDLVEHNLAINEFCKQSSGQDGKVLNPPNELQVGDVYCLRYSFDGHWYRAQVRQCDNIKRECDVNFIDYGNVETQVSYNQLLRVQPKDLPAIERMPFGIYCTLEHSDKLDELNQKLVLEALQEEYVLIKALERLGVQHWRVDVPKLAYNTQFWLAYEKEKNKLKKKLSEIEEKDKEVERSSRLQEEIATE